MNSYRKICNLFFILFLSLKTFSQNKNEVDTTYISTFPNKIIIKLNLDTRDDIFYINDESDNTILEIAENTNVKLNFSLNYDFIGFTFGFAPNFASNRDEHLKGDSSYRNYQFRFFFKKWLQQVRYHNIRGFYVVNSGDFIPNWQKDRDPYIQFPNLKIIQWGGETSYIFNQNFSLRNLSDQTRLQRKSAGSFIVSLDYQYQRFSNRVENIKSVENAFDVKLQGGYYYTWVIRKHWFLSSYISPLVGYRFLNFEEDVSENKKYYNDYILAGADLGIQLGYNAENLFFGCSATLDSLTYSEDGGLSNITNNRGYAQVYVGYRFKEFKLLRKSLDWVKSQI
ncbi:DUF4421 family protein [Aureivirga sp. CE67]|uniref:DUF4421 family protein n=1 Tax=Aureivirga sp. CE67 TaxID=1788983 RepID=UPI0018CB0D67|nr:DUF4421 family protein [Aureivirga sp. CE67]